MLALLGRAVGPRLRRHTALSLALDPVVANSGSGVHRIRNQIIRRGALKVEIGASYALADASKAHRDLEAGAFAGSAVLVP